MFCRFNNVSYCGATRRIAVGAKTGQLALYELRASKSQVSLTFEMRPIWDAFPLPVAIGRELPERRVGREQCALCFCAVTADSCALCNRGGLHLLPRWQVPGHLLERGEQALLLAGEPSTGQFMAARHSFHSIPGYVTRSDFIVKVFIRTTDE